MTVELFRASLDLDDPLLERFAATLSADELGRAAARRGEQDRRRFIADHGWRRRLLSERLGCAPDALTVVESEEGKPRVAADRPHFSASRSDGVAWYAVSDDAEVGVDVERVDAERALDPLARRLLTARERASYEALSGAERAGALTACWACKEAAVKALGTGLVFPLTTLEAWSADGGPIRAEGLEIRGLEAGEGRAAAVAVRVAADETPAIEPVVELSLP